MDVDNLNDYLCATQAGERTFTDTANDLLPYHPDLVSAPQFRRSYRRSLRVTPATRERK